MFYTKYGGHYITLTTVSTPDGTVALIAPASCSVSPAHGDQRITGSFLKKDLTALEDPETVQLPIGLVNLLRGSRSFFVVLFGDSGKLHFCTNLVMYF